MASLYREPTVKAPSRKKLADLAQRLGMDLSDEELHSYQEIITDTVRGPIQRLYNMPDPKLPVKYPRTPGYRPSSHDNPYGAWYWKSDIKGAVGGRLHGKTLAIKDNICVAGVPMMNGSTLLEGYIPDVDATVITRILDEGGHILGKAVCEDLCCSFSSVTSASGPVVNPHDPTRTTGGSSSGSAALVAGGHVDMALSGDQGGSIRVPASFCGIVGLKPTFGLVPYTGICSAEYTVDHVGPMARTVQDVALLLEVIAGRDEERDPRQPRDLQVPSYTEKLSPDISSLRIGVLQEGFGFPDSDPDVDRLVREAADRLAKETGATLEQVSVPMHMDGEDLRDFVVQMRDQEAYDQPEKIQGVFLFTRFSNAGDLLGTIFFKANRRIGFSSCVSYKGYHTNSIYRAEDLGSRTRANDMIAHHQIELLLTKYLQETCGASLYGKSQNLGLELAKKYDEVLLSCDVLILPTALTTAPKLLTTDIPLKEYLPRLLDGGANTDPFDITGHPALSINAGFSNGLPVGMMIVGRKFDELTVLNVAYAWEKIRDAS